MKLFNRIHGSQLLSCHLVIATQIWYDGNCQLYANIIFFSMYKPNILQPPGNTTNFKQYYVTKLS